MPYLKAWLQAKQVAKESGMFPVLRRMPAVSLLLLLALAGMTTHSSQAAATSGVSPHAWTGTLAGRANLVRPLTGFEGTSNTTYRAGYEAVDWYSYKEINGHWTVPHVSGEGDAAVWVGFNGDSNEVPSDWSGPLVQIGTDSIASSTQDLGCLGTNLPHTFAWFEVIGHGGAICTGTALSICLP